MKVIDTLYKGYRFRSRLEARWAVFFDALGLRWEYEPEEFELPSGRYLPDFFLRLTPGGRYPAGGYWIEIKRAPPSPDELRKFEALCRGSGHHGYILHGAPDEYDPIRVDHDRPYRAHRGHSLFHAAFTALSPSFPDLDAFLAAVNAARGARFEHGESGA